MDDDWCEIGDTDKAWCDHCAYTREKSAAELIKTLTSERDALRQDNERLKAALDDSEEEVAQYLNKERAQLRQEVERLNTLRRCDHLLHQCSADRIATLEAALRVAGDQLDRLLHGRKRPDRQYADLRGAGCAFSRGCPDGMCATCEVRAENPIAAIDAALGAQQGKGADDAITEANRRANAEVGPSLRGPAPFFEKQGKGEP